MFKFNEEEKKYEEAALIHKESHESDENGRPAFDPLRRDHSLRQQYEQHDQGN